MGKIGAIILVLLNLSSAPLEDVIVVHREDGYDVGCISRGQTERIIVAMRDSIRVVFKVAGSDKWLGTELMPVRDTITLSNSTKTFEVDIEKF